MLPNPLLRTAHLFLEYNLRKTTLVKAKRKFLHSFHNKEKKNSITGKETCTYFIILSKLWIFSKILKEALVKILQIKVDWVLKKSFVAVLIIFLP